MLRTKTTLRSHYDEGRGEPFGDTWNQCRHEHEHEKERRGNDRNVEWDTQTCGERLKGLNKLFISGAGFWRCESATGLSNKGSEKEGRKEQANICKTPNPTAGT